MLWEEAKRGGGDTCFADGRKGGVDSCQGLVLLVVEGACFDGRVLALLLHLLNVQRDLIDKLFQFSECQLLLGEPLDLSLRMMELLIQA